MTCMIVIKSKNTHNTHNTSSSRQPIDKLEAGEISQDQARAYKLEIETWTYPNTFLAQLRLSEGLQGAFPWLQSFQFMSLICHRPTSKLPFEFSLAALSLALL